MIKIVLIDDNTAQLENLVDPLENDQHSVLLTSGPTAIKKIWHESPDIILLNLMISDANGFEICRRSREMGVPFILVTGNQVEENDIVKALEMGADDYLRSPIVPAVLQIKVRNLVRRNTKAVTGNRPVYDDGHLSINLETRRIEIDNKTVKLTPTEFRLLSILLRQADRVVTHEELIKETWGTEKDTSLGSLKLYIHYLRQKIEASPRKPRYLVAEWGIGYRFQPRSHEKMSQSAA
jgi:two-component system KDP operon response regulator KdpE